MGSDFLNSVVGIGKWGMANKPLPDRIEKICREWDDLQKANEVLANQLYGGHQRIPRKILRTGRTSAIFLGLAFGSFPCFAAKAWGIPWNYAITLGSILLPLGICISVLAAITRTDGGVVHSINLLRLFAVREAARADAMWKSWESEELVVINRMIQISTELDKFVDRKDTTETSYLAALSEFLSMRLHEESRLGLHARVNEDQTHPSSSA